MAALASGLSPEFDLFLLHGESAAMCVRHVVHDATSERARPGQRVVAAAFAADGRRVVGASIGGPGSVPFGALLRWDLP